MPQRPSTKKQIGGRDSAARATRRPRGEPRRLLLDAARDLFARQDYRSTTTREIAEAAGVIEPLLFRHFGSKAALFRETMVVPFTSFVDDFGRTWQAVVPEETDEDELARLFVGTALRRVRGTSGPCPDAAGLGGPERGGDGRSRHR